MGAGGAFIRRNDQTPGGQPFTGGGGSTSIPNGPSPSNGKMGNRNADGSERVVRTESPQAKARREAALRAAQVRNMGVWGDYDFGDRSNLTFEQMKAQDLDRDIDMNFHLFSQNDGTSKWAGQKAVPWVNGMPVTPPTPPTPTTNPGGPGGPGGPSANDVKQWNDYQAAQLAILAGMNPYDVGPAPVDTMTGKINTAVDADVGAVRGAWGGVPDLNTNAYRDMPAVNAQIANPNIDALLSAQGMEGDFAAGTQMQQQQEMDELAALWSHFGSAEAARTDQANAGRNALVDEMEALDIADTEQQRSSLLAGADMNFEQEMKGYESNVRSAAAQNKDARRKKVEELLMEGLANGMDISGIDINSLLGGL